MKKNKLIVTWVTRVIVTFVLSMSMGFLGHADEPETKIILGGQWDEGSRSISLSIPVTAYITPSHLFIQSESLRSDITVTVLKDGETIYEQTVPAVQTANFGISVTDWEKGTYTLELRNQWGDYLYGDFVR